MHGGQGILVWVNLISIYLCPFLLILRSVFHSTYLSVCACFSYALLHLLFCLLPRQKDKATIFRVMSATESVLMTLNEKRWVNKSRQLPASYTMHVHTHTHTHTHVHAHTHIHTHSCARTHAHTHTYVLARIVTIIWEIVVSKLFSDECDLPNFLHLINVRVCTDHLTCQAPFCKLHVLCM